MTSPSKKLVEHFFQAIAEQDTFVVREMLNAGMAPDVIGPDRLSALFAATVSHDHATVLALLDAGANPSLAGGRSKVVGEFGSPLNYACAKGLRTLSELLLDRGASPSMVSNDGRDAAHHLLRHAWSNSVRITPLWAPYAERMIKKMLKAGLDPNTATKDGCSLLQAAVQTTNVPMAIFDALFEHGADPAKADVNGWNFLHFAANSGRIDIVQALIRSGHDINTLDHLGRTPLFRCFRVEATIELLKMGVKINVQDHKGNTALHEQVKTAENDANSVSERLSLLLASGAIPDLVNGRGERPADIAHDKGLDAAKHVLAAASAKNSINRVIARRTPN